MPATVSYVTVKFKVTLAQVAVQTVVVVSGHKQVSFKVCCDRH